MDKESLRVEDEQKSTDIFPDQQNQGSQIKNKLVKKFPKVSPGSKVRRSKVLEPIGTKFQGSEVGRLGGKDNCSMKVRIQPGQYMNSKIFIKLL